MRETPYNYSTGRGNGYGNRSAVWGDPVLGAAFVILHLPLGWFMQSYPVVATAHALATLVIGVLWALTSHRLDRIAYLVGYVVGAEVLWRMSRSQIFWEFGKYTIIAVMLIVLFRVARRRLPLQPVVYFLLLLPSAVLTFDEFDLEIARQQLSFNLSGPLLLMASALLFSFVGFSRNQLVRLLLITIAPILSIAAFVLQGIVGNVALTFSHYQSNMLTSGGFGPNQVSAVFGLAGLFCFLGYMFVDKTMRHLRMLCLAGLILFISLALLTFSRGGVLMAAISIAVAIVYFARSARIRAQLLTGLLALFLVVYYYLLPDLNEFSGGALSNRYQRMDVTGRDKLMRNEWETWKENPLLGVGPGGASLRHMTHNQSVASHTEFTRMLAEHGLFGLMGLVVLLAMARKVYKNCRSPETKAIVAAFIGWSFLFMLTNGMRIAAPSVLFGITFAKFLFDARMPERTNGKGYLHLRKRQTGISSLP